MQDIKDIVNNQDGTYTVYHEGFSVTTSYPSQQALNYLSTREETNE